MNRTNEYIKEFEEYIDDAIQSLSEREKQCKDCLNYEEAIKMRERKMQMNKVKENFTSILGSRVSGHMISSLSYNTKKILQVIGGLQREVEDYGKSGVPRGEIVSKCEAEGMDKEMIETAINHLKLVSNIYFCPGGGLKVSKFT